MKQERISKNTYTQTVITLGAISIMLFGGVLLLLGSQVLYAVLFVVSILILCLVGLRYLYRDEVKSK